MLLSDLQNKDIISTDSGENLGRIIDIEIDNTGKILHVFVEQKRIFRKYFNNSDFSFKFGDIVKIGTDVILVKI